MTLANVFAMVCSGIGLILAFFGGIVHIDSKFREQVSLKVPMVAVPLP